MAKKADEWKTDDRGRFRRIIGWKIDKGMAEDGHTFKVEKPIPQPFYLGTDLDQAKARYLRVKELWSYLLQQYENTKFDYSQHTRYGYPPSPFGWNSESLYVAKELAAGRVQITVKRSEGQPPDGYAFTLSRLGREYPMVIFVPEDRASFEEGADYWRKAAERELSQIQKMPVNIVGELTATFHEALAAYIQFVETTDLEPSDTGPRTTAFGVTKMEQAKRVKGRQKNIPLSALDFFGCQSLLDFWRNRPLKKSRKKDATPRPMTKKTCENHVAELMRFFRWLHKSSEFNWRKPEDFDELTTKVKEIEEERTSIAHLQVKVYSIDEMAILNKYATPIERVLLLLGLNCGFRGAEQGTLLLDHIFLDRPHPHAATLHEIEKFECQSSDHFVLYSRNKSKVYGEFLLWRQTVDAIRWALTQQHETCSRLGIVSRHLLLTKDGDRFFRRTKGNKNSSQIFSSKWISLTARILKDYPDFPKHPFGTLRDTGANLVRQFSTGEIGAVFICHGKPVRKDDLLDLYTNRPFGSLFRALRQIEEVLKPVFDAAPADPWTQPQQQYTTLGKRERILELHKAGQTTTQIAEKVGVGRMTVIRLIQKQSERKKPKPRANSKVNG
jgi:hypothetical protein